MASDFSINVSLDGLVQKAGGIWSIDAFGVTLSGISMPVLLHKYAYSHDQKIKVLLVSGFGGRYEDLELTLDFLDTYSEKYLESKLLFTAIPCVKLDQLYTRNHSNVENDSYPPHDGYFDHPSDPESRYLWRWTSFLSPDLIIELVEGSSISYEVNKAAKNLLGDFDATLIQDRGTFIEAIGGGGPSGLDVIPGIRITMPIEGVDDQLADILEILAKPVLASPSLSQRVLNARTARTPIDVAKILSSKYGHSLSPVVYTQGVAISGRLRLMKLGNDYSSIKEIIDLVEEIKDPKDLFDENSGTPALAGLIWGDELSDITGDRRYSDLVIGVADIYKSKGAGIPPTPSDPDFRTEDMFMNAAMLGRAFSITGKSYYADMLVNFLLEADIQQSNGLFWHSRTAPYYWGRGNGFAAIGFAEALSYIPKTHTGFQKLLKIHIKHLESLKYFQCASGMFSQVLDFPGSYEELTATCMIGYSVAKGIRMGWLDSSFEKMLQRCWDAASKRIEDDGTIVDGCTGTGVQSSVRGYLDRPAIYGFDDRTGSMAIWFATEIEHLYRKA